MHYRIKLEDEHGWFWLSTRGDRTWSDVSDDAVIFEDYNQAKVIAEALRHDVSQYIDWFPRITIIKWTH